MHEAMGYENGPKRVAMQNEVCTWARGATGYVGISGAVDDNNSQGKVCSSLVEKRHADF